jgi:hypothetical protein
MRSPGRGEDSGGAGDEGECAEDEAALRKQARLEQSLPEDVIAPIAGWHRLHGVAGLEAAVQGCGRAEGHRARGEHQGGCAPCRGAGPPQKRRREAEKRRRSRERARKDHGPAEAAAVPEKLNERVADPEHNGGSR